MPSCHKCSTVDCCLKVYRSDFFFNNVPKLKLPGMLFVRLEILMCKLKKCALLLGIQFLDYFSVIFIVLDIF